MHCRRGYFRYFRRPEAAALGKRVVLFDALPMLGGQAVGSIIGTFCGLFSNGPNRQLLTHGIADGILRDLGASGDLHQSIGPLTTVVYYDEVALGRWIGQKVLDAGITVVLGAVLREVVREGTRVQEVELATRYGDVRVAADGFIDASGDAALVWNAGLACREPDTPIYGTQMFVLSISMKPTCRLARSSPNGSRKKPGTTVSSATMACSSSSPDAARRRST